MFPAMAVSTSHIDLATPFYAALKEASVLHPDLSLKHVACLMGITEPQLHQQLHGQGHLSMPRLMLCAKDVKGRAFLRAYWPRVADEMGLGDLADALRMAETFGRLMDTFQVRMARAELRRDERQKERA